MQKVRNKGEEEELVVYHMLCGSGRKRMMARSCLDESPN